MLDRDTAYEEGRSARAAGKGEDAMPEAFRATRSLAKAWRKGFSEVPAMKVQSPQITTRPLEVRTRSAAADLFWPAGQPLPSLYHRPPVPCPECRRLLTDERGRAAAVSHSRDGFTFFSCRCCGHRWKLKNRTA